MSIKSELPIDTYRIREELIRYLLLGSSDTYRQ